MLTAAVNEAVGDINEAYSAGLSPGGLGIAGGGGPGGRTPAGATGGRGTIEMPNIQALGLSSGGGQSGNQPMAGLNIGALPPMNPALVAAALNQAADGSPWATYNLWHCQNQNRPDLLAFLCQNPPADHDPTYEILLLKNKNNSKK